MMMLSLSTSYVSAATYNYYLGADRGAYVTYGCLFSNSSNSWFNTRTTMGFMLFDKSMLYNGSFTYQTNTYYIEGAFIGLYFNGTLEDWGDVNIQSGPPYGTIFLPSSDAWWTFIKTFAEDPANNPTGINNVTIGSSEAYVTMFTSGGGYNGTLWLTIDRHLGVTTKFGVLSIQLSNTTNRRYYEYELLQLSTLSPPLVPGTIPAPVLVGVAGVAGLAVSLIAGYFIGARTGRRAKK